MDVSKALEASAKAKKGKFLPTEVARATPDELDVGNLAAHDVTAVDLPTNSKKRDKKLTELARDTTQVLFNSIWGLETERQEIGYIVAKLPAPTTVLPREKPIPAAKGTTKWEKFAAEKGIQKRKRARMEFDEDSQEYRPRFGYGSKANKEPWVIEVPKNIDPNTDMYAKLREEKNERVQKNEKQRLRNAGVPKLAKPIDQDKATRQEKKINIDAQLQVSKQSTASMGRFDEKLKGEPKSQVKKREKRKFTPNENTSSEQGRNKDILTRLLSTSHGTLNVKQGANRAANKLKYEEAMNERNAKAKRRKKGN